MPIRCGHCRNYHETVEAVRVCSRAPGPVTTTTVEPITEGVYQHPDGLIFKVQTSRESGRLYAKIFCDVPGDKPRFVFPRCLARHQGRVPYDRRAGLRIRCALRGLLQLLPRTHPRGVNAPGLRANVCGEERLALRPRSRLMRCRCGYDAKGELDLEEHVLAMMHVDDGSSHGAD